MKIVDDYKTRIQRADTAEQKGTLASELHHIADSFNPRERAEYEQAMNELRQHIAQQLDVIDPIHERAKAILNRYVAVKS